MSYPTRRQIAEWGTDDQSRAYVCRMCFDWLHVLDWCPLLIAAAVFWAALG